MAFGLGKVLDVGSHDAVRTQELDPPGEIRGERVEVVRGIVEDPADAVRIPLREQIHPEPSVGVADVLEEVGAIGRRGGAEVRQHLLQSVRPIVRMQQLLRHERQGARHAVGSGLERLHTPFVSALRANGLKRPGLDPGGLLGFRDHA